MKFKSLVIVAILFCSQSFAQETAVADTSWKKSGLFSIGFGQVALDNWAGGGLNSMNANAILSLQANYLKDGHSWDNSLDLGYGILKQGDNDATKSDDRIELNSKYGKQAWSENWYYSILGNFKTQFTEGLGTPTPVLDTAGVQIGTEPNRISDLMSPGYGLLALGLDYKPNEHFSLFISPVTAKFTFVGDQTLADAGAYGVDAATYSDLGVLTSAGSNSRTELGAYLRGVYNTKLMENITLGTKLDLFTNYQESPFTHTDVNWELLLGLKVNEYISANLGFQTVYDHDIQIQDGDKVGPRTQFKQIFGVGFSYTM